ncbi:GNAT family N-acetyltransferase [Allobranchiibius sp. CTAmp26]|nr:GNAT family N-acetyltransferase [Allobranchiibius sp. CTAmp26]
MTNADLDEMTVLLGSPQVMRYYARPKTRAEAASWIEWSKANYARDGYGLWLLHDEHDRFVGECGLTWQTMDDITDLEVGYHVLPQFQGRGLATEAAIACREFARSRGVTRLTSNIFHRNRPSQRVAEKVGMQLERETIDPPDRPIGIWSMTLSRASTS